MMLAARESGVMFLDDARYNDESGLAPLATGYSEVVFGELFRAAAGDATSVVREQALVGVLAWAVGVRGARWVAPRMGFDYLDLVYSWSAPEGRRSRRLSRRR